MRLSYPMKYIIALLSFVFIYANAFSQDKISRAKAQNTNQITPKPIPSNALKPLNVPIIYSFIGNGNWSNPNNWDANGVPPDQTNPGSKININNVPGGICYLDVPYVVKSGTLPTSLTVFTGSNLVIPEDLIVK